MIKLSKEGKEILERVKKVSDELSELVKDYGKLTTKEQNLIGTVIYGVYSPLGELAGGSRFGNSIVLEGLVEMLKDQLVRRHEQGKQIIVPLGKKIIN